MGDADVGQYEWHTGQDTSRAIEESGPLHKELQAQHRLLCYAAGAVSVVEGRSLRRKKNWRMIAYVA